MYKCLTIETACPIVVACMHMLIYILSNVSITVCEPPRGHIIANTVITSE